MTKNWVTMIGAVVQPFERCRDVGNVTLDRAVLRIDDGKHSNFVYVEATRETLAKCEIKQGDSIRAFGEIRSYRVPETDKPAWYTCVVAKSISKVPEDTKNVNDVFVSGCLCAKPLVNEVDGEFKSARILMVVDGIRGTKYHFRVICYTPEVIASIAKLKVADKVRILGRIYSNDPNQMCLCATSIEIPSKYEGSKYTSDDYE